MRILFCNIAWMDYYKGIVPGKDEPKNGGSYVKDTKDAHEKYNFKPELLKLKGFPEGEYCLGFVETKSTSAGKRNQLNIEKIEGCSDLKNDTEVDDVLVVYCALYPDSFDKETYVVGWYKHATVYRRYEKLEFDTEASDNERSDNESAADEKYIQLYNAIALKEDCVLLPRSQRRKTFWKAENMTRLFILSFMVRMNRRTGQTRRSGKKQIRHSIRPSEWIRWWLRVILQRKLPEKKMLSDSSV